MRASIISIFTVLLLVVTASTQVLAGTGKEPIPPGMVLVPAGAFTMGTDGGQGFLSAGDDGPAHQVKLPAFYMDKYEVTNAEYKQYCDATGYPAPPHWKNGTFPQAEAQWPVRFVNWWEASAYATWKGKRLPTEAEWEKAARGTDGRTYPWGNSWDSSLLIWGTDSPQAVGSKPAGASPYGVLDMAGNIWEWVSDWYQAYPGSTSALPDYGKSLKVARGGSYGGWEGKQYDCATYHRSLTRPQSRSEWIGFRCAKNAPQP